jgi:hypothetical protein
MVSIDDQADRAPRPLAPDEVIDLGGKRVRNLDTPHVPHGWDAHSIIEETTNTLFCGDLMSQVGQGPAITGDDLLGDAALAELLREQAADAARSAGDQCDGQAERDGCVGAVGHCGPLRAWGRTGGAGRARHGPPVRWSVVV